MEGKVFAPEPERADSVTLLGNHPATYSCPTISTEISTAGVVSLFSSQCVVLRSSGHPTPGP